MGFFSSYAHLLPGPEGAATNVDLHSFQHPVGQFEAWHHARNGWDKFGDLLISVFNMPVGTGVFGNGRHVLRCGSGSRVIMPDKPRVGRQIQPMRRTEFHKVLGAPATGKIGAAGAGRGLISVSLHKTAPPANVGNRRQGYAPAEHDLDRDIPDHEFVATGEQSVPLAASVGRSGR